MAALSFKYLFTFAFVGMAFGFVSEGRAQTIVEKMHSSDLEIIIEDLGGYDIDIGTDSYGDPEIDAYFDDLVFSVLFYACEGEYCEQIQFRGVFETDRASARKAARKQNSDLVFGKSYLDSDGDAVIELAVSSKGGVTMDYLYAQTDLWFEIFRDFATDLDY